MGRGYKRDGADWLSVEPSRADKLVFACQFGMSGQAVVQRFMTERTAEPTPRAAQL